AACGGCSRRPSGRRRRGRDIEREEKARRTAIAASLDEWLNELSEAERVKIFAGIEAKGAGKRYLIQHSAGSAG
ncbi:hypothetical protein, partial [Amaricoccus sp.]|uniref:hypothetical protein n=1 Tax=Amaricoccus sp. TaxID=1872485 RepID=UPI002C1436A1